MSSFINFFSFCFFYIGQFFIPGRVSKTIKTDEEFNQLETFDIIIYTGTVNKQHMFKLKRSAQREQELQQQEEVQN